MAGMKREDAYPRQERGGVEGQVESTAERLSRFHITYLCWAFAKMSLGGGKASDLYHTCILYISGSSSDFRECYYVIGMSEWTVYVLSTLTIRCVICLHLAFTRER